MRFSLFALLAAGSLFAQRPAAGGFSHSMVSPSAAPRPSAPSAARPAPARVPPAPVANGGFRHSPPPTATRSPFRPRPVIVPVPVYYGGYYYGYPAYGYGGGYPQPDPPAAYGQQYADPYQNQPPAVIYNQDFRPDAVNPQIRDYSNVPLPPPGAQNNPDADQPSYFLIASIDHAIVAVVTYWVDGETLNFITTDGDRKSMPLDQVDREFSKQLNADRRIEFKLPAK